ncbi:hypothetical protein WKK05_11350 [Nostoc sp. UHCC 0302]|uniref:hypothetical protein n=1 Tax=Nostoc sp. UHCC 0302 TaxID=3134896 RepID=UPI00311CDAD2
MDAETAAFLVQILHCVVPLKSRISATGISPLREVIGRSSLTLPELWGGEVGLANAQMSTICGQNKGNGLTDTQVPDSLLSKEFYTRNPTKSITSQSSSDKGAITQTIVLSREQSTVESFGTHNESTLLPVKSTPNT